MKIWQVVCVLAAVAVPGWALAEESVPEPKALGTTEAILEYCAKADPPSADRYREQIKLLAQGASEETLVKVRNSDAYQQAHKSVDEFLAKVDERNAKKACERHLAPGQ